MSTIDPKVDDHSEDAGEAEDVSSPSMSAEARKKALANKKKREKAKLKKQAQKEGGEHKDDVDLLAQGFQDLSMHQFFTNNTKLAYTRSKGRHVIATQPITAGTPIFEIAPYAGVVLDHVIDQYCHRCYQTASVLYMCKECKHARFCSTTCMNAFSTIHLLECNTLGKLPELEMSGESAPLRMIVRMLYLHHQEQKYLDKNARRKAENKGNIWTAKPGLSFEDAISLVSHQDEFDQQTKLSIMLIVSRLEKLVDASVWQGTDIATKLLLQVQCNAHHITDPNKRRIGLGLYVPAAYLNHSCRPTCVYHFVNGNIVMTAISDVKEGEELTYSYIDLYQPKRVRDQRLAETYFIKNCDCARCQEPPSTSFDRFLGGYHCPSCTSGELTSTTSDTYTCSSCQHTVKSHVIDDVEKEAKLIFDSALQMLNVGDCKEAEDQLETKLVHGHPSQYLHRFHTLLFNSYLLLIGSSRALQEYDKQLTYCQLVIDGLNGCSLHNHPEMGDAYMSQGQATQALAHSAERKYQRKKKEMGDAIITTTTTDTDSTSPSTSSTDTLDSLRERYIDLLRQCIQSYECALNIRTICFGRKHTWTRETHNVLQDVTSELEKLTSSGNSQKKKQAKKKK